MTWFLCVSSKVSVHLSWEDIRACLSSVDAAQNLPEQKAGLVRLSFKYYSDIKMARELLMVHTAFIVCK